MTRRFLGSLAIGALAAAALVAFEDRYRHAALAASAARPLPHGGHQTVAAVLTAGGVFTAVIVTVIVFAVATVRARRRRASLVSGRDWDTCYPEPRRGRAGLRR